MIACLAGVVILIRSTAAKRRASVDEHRLEGMENGWAVIVGVLLVTMLAATIWSIPYDDTDASAGAQRVRVIAQQFGWNVQPSTIQAGRPVQFSLHSKDVQHGFGVYDGTKLVMQVQVPAKGEPVQQITHTFDKRGTYEINCLEFCGYQHHMMRGTLRVR